MDKLARTFLLYAEEYERKADYYARSPFTAEEDRASAIGNCIWLRDYFNRLASERSNG